MGSITLTIKYRVNTGIALSTGELSSLYLYGITFNSNNGMDFSNENIRFYILSAQKETENYFNLKLNRQLVMDETMSYYRDDYYRTFPIIRTQYPVRQPLSMVGMLNKVEQIIFPQTWLAENRNSDGKYPRRISVVPTGASTAQQNADVILTGITTQIGYQRFGNIPSYWDYQYITGFDIDTMPMDLIKFVGMMASLGLLGIAGDLILGAGISSQSIAVDGLSQAISSTASATNSGYGARIIQYQKTLSQMKSVLSKVYDEIHWVTA